MKTFFTPKRLCLSLGSVCLLLPCADLRAEDWHYSLQAGIASMPRYSGSDERTVAPLLGAEIVSPYGLFLNTQQGLGWGNEWEHLSFSTWVGLSEVRKDHETGYKGSNRLDGMGSIKSRAQFGAHLGYTLGNVVLGATLLHALKKNADHDTGSAYSHLELSISSNLYKGDYGSLDGSLNSQFGDSDYLQTWYGVSSAQATHSGYRAYRARGGLLSRGGDLTWSLPLSEHLELSTVLAVQYLDKEAADSPIVDRRLQTLLATQIEYSF